MNTLKSPKRIIKNKKATAKAITAFAFIVIIILAATASAILYYKIGASHKSSSVPPGTSGNSGKETGNNASTDNSTYTLLDDTKLTLSSDNGEAITFNASQILAMPKLSGLGGYCKTIGNVQTTFYVGDYVGVPIEYLCNLVGGINSGSLVQETCSDGYTADLSYKQVYNAAEGFSDELYNPNSPYHSGASTYLTSQNATEPMTLILAYGFSNSSYNGALPDGFNLRVMAVGPEGLVSWGAYSGFDVTGLQVLYAPSAPLTFNTCNSSGSIQSTFNVGSSVYFEAEGLSASTTYTVYVVQHQNWVIGSSIPARVPGTSTSVTTDSSGNVALTSIYNSASVGEYDVIVKSDNDGKFDADDLLLTLTVSTPSSQLTSSATPTPSASTVNPTSTPTPTPTITPTSTPTQTSTKISLQPFTLTVTGAAGTITLTQDNITALPTTTGLGGYTQTVNNVQQFFYTGEYTGVSLQYLCNLVGGINVGCDVDVIDKTSPPSYDYDFQYQQITDTATAISSWFNATSGAEQKPTQPITVIIAYEFNGTALPTGVGPLRDMFVGSEGLVTWGTYSVYLVDTINVNGQSTPYLTYAICNSDGVAQSTFKAGDTVYFSAAGLSASTTYNVLVTPYQSSWSTGMAIPTAVSATKITTSSSGAIELTPIYANAQAGKYDVVVKPTSETDDKYDAQDILITNVASSPGPGVLVSAFDPTVVLAACLAVFTVYATFKKTVFPRMEPPKNFI